MLVTLDRPRTSRRGMNGEFAALLRLHRTRAYMSGAQVAKLAGIDPSYYTRIERSSRPTPTLGVVDAIARVLDLNDAERNTFFFAAGYAPTGVTVGNGWNDTLQAVVDVLADPHLTTRQKERFSEKIRTLSLRWRTLGE